jgi:hypothetical protein
MAFWKCPKCGKGCVILYKCNNCYRIMCEECSRGEFHSGKMSKGIKSGYDFKCPDCGGTSCQYVLEDEKKRKLERTENPY